MRNKETDHLGGDEMKHSVLARFRMFLENNIAAILALFIPVWLGLLFVWAVVLRALEAANLLPSGISLFLLTACIGSRFVLGQRFD